MLPPAVAKHTTPQLPLLPAQDQLEDAAGTSASASSWLCHQTTLLLILPSSMMENNVHLHLPLSAVTIGGRNKHFRLQGGAFFLPTQELVLLLVD